MNINFKKTLFMKKQNNENNFNSPNKEYSLLNKIDLLDYATLKKMHGLQQDLELHENTLSNDELLISELKKIVGETKKPKLTDKIIQDSDSKSSSINNNTSKNSENVNNNIIFPKRNNNIILRCLQQYPNFIKYMKFHNISIDLLEKICPFLMHKFVQKDSYLFKEKQNNIFFFCLINGKIGLRTFEPSIILENKRKYDNEDINMEKIFTIKKKKIINSPKVEKKKEDNKNDGNNINVNVKEDINKNNLEEKPCNKYFEINYENIPGINKLLKEGYDTKILKKGDCYGIYNLLNNQPYDVNGIALENTDIFYLEKEFFDKYLLTAVSRIDMERKYLINKLIPVFPMELISYIKPEIYDNNHIIYTEFDYAFECIYIYKGSAELKKYSSAKTKSEIYEHKNILKTISKIEEGGIAGLEICKGPTSFYDNILMITDANTIIYRINLLNLKGKKQMARSNIKKFFTNLYEQQNTFLKKVEEKNQEYKEIYKISQKIEKPKFNYSDFFNSIFKDVNPPNKTKRNKLNQYKFKNLNLEKGNIYNNNSNKKLKLNILNSFHNKGLYNNRYKTFNSQKKFKSNFFSLYNNNNKNKKKYTLNLKSMSRNDEEKEIPMFNSFNIYNSLSTSSKVKSQKQMNTISHESKYISHNDNKENNFQNNNIKSIVFSQESQKNDDISFPQLIKNNSTKNKNHILSKKYLNNKHNKVNSVDKCLYDSGDFKIPFVTLSDNINSKNIKKIKNLTHYSKLKKLILCKKLLL